MKSAAELAARHGEFILTSKNTEQLMTDIAQRSAGFRITLDEILDVKEKINDAETEFIRHLARSFTVSAGNRSLMCERHMQREITGMRIAIFELMDNLYESNEALTKKIVVFKKFLEEIYGLIELLRST